MGAVIEKKGGCIGWSVDFSDEDGLGSWCWEYAMEKGRWMLWDGRGLGGFCGSRGVEWVAGGDGWGTKRRGSLCEANRL